MGEAEREVLRLSDVWMKYVCLGHHKDRDCHWVIKKTWSYGEGPKWKAEHYGYIYKGRTGCFDTYYEAEQAILSWLRDAISKEKEWAKMVLSKPDDWDPCQQESARFISGVEL